MNWKEKMIMEIVSGRIGKPHVTSQQFRQLIEGTVGQESCILTSGENLEPELASNNSLKIRSGMLAHHGNISSVKIGTYDAVNLSNGSQGMKRIDLVVCRYTRNAETEVESCNWVVIMGTPVSSNPVAPTYTVGNLQEGDLVDDCPVFEVHYDGINVTEVRKILSVAPNLTELNSKTIQIIKNNDSQQIYDLCGGKIRVVSGSAVKNVRGTDYICLVDKDELNEIFGQSYSITRLSIATCNGDNEATNTRFLGAEIWQGHIYQYFAQKLSCSVRINYRIVYTYP